MSSMNSVESFGTLQWDMLELAAHLRQERLFVNAEQQNLQTLNEKVLYISSDLAQLTWVTDQQRVNLNRLIVSRPDSTPASCCQRANTLENSQFVDAYKHLKYQSCLAYGEFLGTLRKSPKLVASCLVEGDKLVPDSIQSIIQSLSAGLYGSCLLPEDKLFVLKLLRHLMFLQIVPSDNPRRLLRHGTCAFSRFYSVFHESLFSAKLFLTAALHEPIIQLLMEDEMFLDIDPDKAAIRFPPSERLKKFGKEGTPEYQSKLLRYRLWTVNSLVRITQRFIVSIRENMYCFPTSVSWLVKQMAGLLNKNSNIEPKEVHAMCTDLVFTYFICPAIVNPEPYGITDAPISYVARFNLMQVGQILQMLSLMKYQTIDNKVIDLYRRFEKDSISSIIDAMLEGTTEELDDEPPVVDNTKLQGLCRSAALFTENELNNLIVFLHTVNNENNKESSAFSHNSLDRKQLCDMLAQLPSGTVSSNKIIHQSSPETPSKRGGFLGKVNRGRGSRISVPSSPGIATDGTEDMNGASGTEEEYIDKAIQEVLVIPFGPAITESVGMLSEQKILCMDIQNNVEESVPVTLTLDTDLTTNNDRRDTNGPDRIETQEKRTRFSLSHDEVLFEGSIGNTSDNLEVVSEAASNHSVASSLELETEDQNDNLSDMVSANVSGRGTPNISGRDTPSSQITEGDDVRAGGEARQLDLPPPTIPTKQSRSEIDDKFCKFEIKKLIEGDETVSLVSDTWSTDVLASDSEIVEQQERFPFPPPTEAPPVLPQEPPQGMLDVSETASEAWSTDVLASDSERLTEVDTDDTASVARSDDTARSEFESRGEPDGGDEPTYSPSLPIGTVVEGAGTLFRPIRVEPANRAPIPPSPTVSTHSNVTGQGGTASDYRRSTMEYVDNNANNVSNMEYGKSVAEDRLIHLIDKLHIDNGKNNNECQSLSSHIGAAAVAPTLLLANHISAPSLPEKLPNGGIKLEELDGCSASNNDVVVRLSSASLTSSSSSGSESRSKNALSTPEILFPQPLTNGGNDVTDNRNNIPKPSISTGAIPKSISFDMTATRGDKELLDEDQKNKRGFFSKFKMSLRNRRGKSPRGTDEQRFYDRDVGPDGVDVGRQRLRRIMSEDVSSSLNTNNDSSEDILAKYRRKPSAASDTASVESSQSRTKEVEDERLLIDPNNVEISFAFSDAKRKLRMVLSTADLQHISWNVSSDRNTLVQKENELVAFLQLQLAEAINLQDRPLIAHLHETLRCVRLFNDDGCRKLFKSLREDYQKRSPYIAYLIRCRQGLLSTLAHLERLNERIKCDRDAVNSHLVAVCVRVFLEKRESQVLRFCDEFQKLKVADEKQDLLDNFLGKIHTEMDNDPIWQVASESQIELAKMVVERTIMARVYHNALYPNGDGDIYRDQLLHDHIKKLSKVVTPNHKDLRIPKIYHYECPWPWAQAELAVISAYKTPKDKLQCVFRCAKTIIHLLSMASERGIPAADDLIPVLVYIIIKTNPPSLLSTVQYVDSFYGNRLEGEEQYWWTQFCSAIEFIKTMD
ncbi:receptor-mediated endocytosis protein 6 homolog [Chelonus insularis]|uniref:receptor-mediated endocytosis protein 6 homolog n=1 Tax=Chelonus insularis TaxID=460826 RepID=UPI00158D2BBA|nr:receptor-mediated endocytosis protein 6 homolog [Chelonus insularis]XP_034936043.1 receptor-mediated endocytosis protein 6 homolog [Chelonus insularis]XP_034936044.1 receptor-mediated endocytosis protein 6 homolog [Chelonus insularis]XP_034936045.1 receptor-mediated endocytosis protein 6 homolog [Chelonus insularis]XP_034936046.1 receptor-mediated endocytosis protein 6 homolog [Chelonus insularis]XP_034936047.1 receptor-mediated endocytosis protein 6 homolog [Chelonus insularis]XP_03493604